MLGQTKPAAVSMYEATGETAFIYHQIRQVLRASGVSAIFRSWAGAEHVLDAMWSALRPNLETRAFEDASDHVREAAAHAAHPLGTLGAVTHFEPTESRAFQIRAALDLHRYLTPKLLLLAAAARLALDGEYIGREGAVATELVERGVPPRMYPMALVDERPDDKQLRDLFRDVRRTMKTTAADDVYRSLALWPDYFTAAWTHLRPLTRGDEFRDAVDSVRETARSLARTLPLPLRLPPEYFQGRQADMETAASITAEYEDALPGTLMNVMLFATDWQPLDALARSPFAAESRAARRASPRTTAEVA
ncbi:MAG TPA: halocarboxylic acid dehydrogenase DehI family protein [Gemmatimonadaceae bacterium]|nr:halocarboxylic acid dehydrogenase DehI family protein [Gemmatimonadaceae bacterium]